jgi:two-component system phosphate regulon response regulator PhoB
MTAFMEDTVLVVEDEKDVVDLLRYNLKRAGFKVLVANTGDAGLAAVRENRPDVVVLDLMMPGMSGLEVCRVLKEDKETALIPIVMLTAKDEAKDRVKGLETGADDYVGKPFSPRELVLRIQALLRRLRSAANASSVIELDGITLDKSSLQAKIDGERLDLTTTEFKLLIALIDFRGRTLSRDVLLKDVWGYAPGVDTRTVDTHMRRLREKLGRHAPRLETIRGEGYRFNALPAT